MNVLKAFKLSAVAAVLVCTASAAFAAESEFSYSGYLRVGYAYQNGLYGSDGNFGLTGKDGGAEKWTGRLGKEANAQYLENTFCNTFTVEGGAWAKLFFTLTCESFNPGTDAQGCEATPGNDIMMRNRQAYVEMGGLGFSPDTSFWVGRRYYHRDDIHVLDWYVLDYSGDGAGVENIAGSGASVALMSHPYIPDGKSTVADTVSKDSKGTAVGKDTFSTAVVQYKIKSFRFDGTYLYRPKVDKLTPAINGQTVSAQYKPDQFFFVAKGSSSIIAQYGRGASAENLWFGNRYTKDSDHSAHINKRAWSYLAAATGLLEIDDQLSICPVVGFIDLHTQASRAIGSTDSKGSCDVTRIFAVVRPHYNFTKNLATELELGFYRLSSAHAVEGGVASAAWGQGCGLEMGQKSNWAIKVTPAVVLTLDNGFWTRPALRLFASYEQVGTKVASNYTPTNKKQNISYGFQAEAWW